MKNAEYNIDTKQFWTDPYPDLKAMQELAAVVHVPQLNAKLFTRREDIFVQEKRIDIFSSRQPGGLMTQLMGENMMRKDGDAHKHERRQIFPSISPRTVRDHWQAQFIAGTKSVIDALKTQQTCDLVTDFAMPVSAAALKAITGLTDMTAAEMDGVSQGMIDGCANYLGDPDITARCHAATSLIDAHIDQRLAHVRTTPDFSVLSVLDQAGMAMDQIRANIKLVISGGQNEPRDAIAGTIWALLSNPDQLAQIQNGKASFQQAFGEYARWNSPIGMSPRELTQDTHVCGADFVKGERIFFMFSAANRDPRVFDQPDQYQVARDTSKAISFGAGPHFCAGAAASRSLIADVALPMFFDAFPIAALNGPVPVGGWAFRGPLSVPVTLT